MLYLQKQITLGAVHFKRMGALLMCTLLAAADVTWRPRALCENGFRIANEVGCKAGRKIYLRCCFVIKVKWQLKFNA